MHEMPTERVHEEMNQVIAEGGGLATVARAVDALNLSLAHHAAWTEERFDKVDKRFDKVDKRLAESNQLRTRVDLGFTMLDARIDVLETSYVELKTSQEAQFDAVEAKIDAVDAKAAERHASLEAKFDRMSARVEEVLNFAIRKEQRVDEIDE